MPRGRRHANPGSRHTTAAPVGNVLGEDGLPIRRRPDACRRLSRHRRWPSAAHARVARDARARADLGARSPPRGSLMRASLPLGSQRLVVVTGKGGVGRTVVTAALAHAAADGGRRVLAVEVGAGRLGPLLGKTLGTEPTPVAPRLSAVTVDGQTALREFILDVLRLRVLARRLLESTSFQLLAAAAPGLSEFLLLHQLTGWLDAHRLGRPLYDLVIVDAPASGHSLPVLAVS